MINGLGIVGWGVGGIEAEAGMLGQPVYFLTPDVVGVHLAGRARRRASRPPISCSSSREMLRKAKVVGKFVEFLGEGAASLPVDRPRDRRQHGARVWRDDGLLPGRTRRPASICSRRAAPPAQVETFRAYYQAQGLFGMPRARRVRLQRDCSSSTSATVRPSVCRPEAAAGPDRPAGPEDAGSASSSPSRSPRTATGRTPRCSPAGSRRRLGRADPGRRQPERRRASTGAQRQDTNPGPRRRWPTTARRRTLEALEDAAARQVDVGHGDVLIAAITSCTNTSNPSVMLAAGLLAKKAVERASRSRPEVKASLAPGSRVVTEYLAKTGLQPYLDHLGFNLVGYGCTTCIGNSGPARRRHRGGRHRETT